MLKFKVLNFIFLLKSKVLSITFLLKSKVLSIMFLLKSKVLNIMFLLKFKVLNITFGIPADLKRGCVKSPRHTLFFVSSSFFFIGLRLVNGPFLFHGLRTEFKRIWPYGHWASAV